MNAYFIIKSNIAEERNWEGKGFCQLPCKIYHTFDDAVGALSGYWFNEYCQPDKRQVIIQPIGEDHLQKLLTQKKVRW